MQWHSKKNVVLNYPAQIPLRNHSQWRRGKSWAMIAVPLCQVQSGPMQRSSRLIVCIPIHSTLDDSSRHHGVNRIFHLSLGLFHPSVAEVLELVSAEEQLQRFAMVLLMMLSLSLRCPVSVLLSVLPFDLPATGVTRSRSAGTGVSAIAIRWASDMWMPHLGRWSSRCLMLL